MGKHITVYWKIWEMGSAGKCRMISVFATIPTIAQHQQLSYWWHHAVVFVDNVEQSQQT